MIFDKKLIWNQEEQKITQKAYQHSSSVGGMIEKIGECNQKWFGSSAVEDSMIKSISNFKHTILHYKA